MYNLTATDNFYSVGRGNTFVVKSPIAGNRFNVKQRLGGVIQINNILYDIVGVEIDMRPTPLELGEEIGIVVEPHTHDKSVHIDVAEDGEVTTSSIITKI